MANHSRTTGGFVKAGMTITPEQLAELEELARETERSVASHVRDAVRAYLLRVRQVREREEVA